MNRTEQTEYAPAAGRTAGRTAGRRVSPVRAVLFSILLTALMAAELYAYYAVFPDFLAWLKEIDHKSCAWIGGQLSFMLPFITICVFQTCVYRKDENGDGMCQLEKAWEILIVSVLVYGALLPYVAHVSSTLHDAAAAEALLNGTNLPKTPGGADKTLMLDVFEWFLRLTVPLMLLGAYHTLRGCRERREYTEADHTENADGREEADSAGETDTAREAACAVPADADETITDTDRDARKETAANAS